MMYALKWTPHETRAQFLEKRTKFLKEYAARCFGIIEVPGAQLALLYKLGRRPTAEHIARFTLKYVGR